MKTLWMSLIGFALAACQSSPAPSALERPSFTEITQRANPQAVGAEYKLEEWVFESMLGNCHLVWETSVPKKEPQTVEIIAFSISKGGAGPDVCEAPMSTKEAVFTQMLKKVREHYPDRQITQFHTGHTQLADQEARMRTAAAESPEWAEYLKSPPKKRQLTVNKVFINLFNAANAGAEWRKLFNDQGLELKLVHVEKVFERDDLPLHAGIYEFAVTKL